MPPPEGPAYQVDPTARYFALDVECVATGHKHSDRAVAQIAVVDAMANPVLNVYVQPDAPVVSYLTPLTGITQQMLQTYGVPLATALQVLRQHLPSNATLVGQNVQSDVQWLGLVEGQDFAGIVDLQGLYRVWNEQYKSFSVFSQDHLATVLLGMRLEGAEHNALFDSGKAMRLFHVYTQIRYNPQAWADACERLMRAPPTQSFAKRNPTFEGVCMGGRKTCSCGGVFFGI